ncbi:MAG TPA: hypothetical protein ENK10_06960 [Acidobacteria bacterium]|nr:hypothetical protein [Acidobacteriota bacterium]
MSADIFTTLAVLGWAIGAWALVAGARAKIFVKQVRAWCDFVHAVGLMEIDLLGELSLSRRHYEAVYFNTVDVLFKLGDWGGGDILIKDVDAVMEVEELIRTKLKLTPEQVKTRLKQYYQTEEEEGED